MNTGYSVSGPCILFDPKTEGKKKGGWAWDIYAIHYYCRI